MIIQNIHNQYTIMAKNVKNTAHHGDNNNWGEYNTVEEVIAAAQNRAKVASKTMPDCLGGGIGASSPVWMRDYSQPNDREPKNPKARDMIGTFYVFCTML